MISVGERVTIKSAKLGMIVALTHPHEEYVIAEGNPAVGSEYECTGEIYSIDKNAGTIEVEWENGKINTYLDSDLSQVHCDDIPIEGRVASIWGSNNDEEIAF